MKLERYAGANSTRLIGWTGDEKCPKIVVFETISYTCFHNHKETLGLIGVQDPVHSKEFDFMSQNLVFNLTMSMIVLIN